jgi:hypothetical protein
MGFPVADFQIKNRSMNDFTDRFALCNAQNKMDWQHYLAKSMSGWNNPR